jgi:GNAT superfamily N-acetyltransferase
VAAGLTVRELAPEESAQAHAAMLELRPGIGTAADFTARIDRVQRPAGYRLVASFENGSDQAAAVAGFRIIDDLVHGRHLYVDDLSTRAASRKRGHAAALMKWLRAEALRQGCAYLSLDSGVHRHDAHRFYLKQGMVISSHHFSLDLAGEAPAR